MYSKNKSGPKIEPCGTPDVTDSQLDFAPFITTCCFYLLSRIFKATVLLEM